MACRTFHLSVSNIYDLLVIHLLYLFFFNLLLGLTDLYFELQKDNNFHAIIMIIARKQSPTDMDLMIGVQHRFQ